MHKQFAVVMVALMVAGPVFAHGDEHHGAKSHEVHGKETAFGRAADPAKAARTILIEMRDPYRFVPDEVEVRTGEIVRFVVVNAGNQMHEMVLGTRKELEEHAAEMRKNPGMHHDEQHMAHAAPGKSGVIAWQFTQPGEFLFACLVDDHFDMGMTGRIRVSGLPLADHGQAEHTEHAHHSDAAMNAWYGPYPMTREASGTAWQPDGSPHQGVH